MTRSLLHVATDWPGHYPNGAATVAVLVDAGIFRNQIRDYAERLTLNHPRVLLPTHWDNFERPYEEGPQGLRDVLGEPGALDTFVRELKRASPRSRVVVLDFFETFEP